MTRVLAWPRSRNEADNPYTALLYDALEDAGAETEEFGVSRALRQDYDVLHVHWPEGILKGNAIRQLLAGAANAAVLMYVRHVRRKPIVWTVHNLGPHRPVNTLALRIVRGGLRRSVSGLIFLSEASRAAYLDDSPWASEIPSVVTPHGRYGRTFLPHETREATRTALGVPSDQCLLAFVGRMEPYKRPDRLVEAFMDLAPRAGTKLLLAGKWPEGDFGRRLRGLARSEDVLIEDSWLSNERMAELLAAADLVVYPYDQILNSGSVVLPLEFGTRVVAPGMGSIPEMASAVGEGWITTYEGDLDAEVLRRAILAGRPPAGPDLRALEWEAIAPTTLDFMRSLLRST